MESIELTDDLGRPAGIASCSVRFGGLQPGDVAALTNIRWIGRTSVPDPLYIKRLGTPGGLRVQLSREAADGLPVSGSVTVCAPEHHTAEGPAELRTFVLVR